MSGKAMNARVLVKTALSGIKKKNQNKQKNQTVSFYN